MVSIENIAAAELLFGVDDTPADRAQMVGNLKGQIASAGNFTGHPCLHLRAGFLDLGTRSQASLGSGKLTAGDLEMDGPTLRVPQDISLWGRLFDDGRLLNLGVAHERPLAVAAERPTFAA